MSPAGQLASLHADFNTINAVLASQINDVVARLNELSPALADLYAVLEENEIFLINEAVRTYRDSAWRFAIILALELGVRSAPDHLGAGSQSGRAGRIDL